MTPLHQAIQEYLSLRRALGHKLARHGRLLSQFVAYITGLGEEHPTTKTALAWATLPKDVHRKWWASRYSIVRGFASHLRAQDSTTEVPAAGLLPWPRLRATPYLYSEQEIASLLQAAATLQPAHRAATYKTFIGLLAVTGMRVGEAIRLDRKDFDARYGFLTIRHAKFNKLRELPLDPSVVEAMSRYLARRNRPRMARSNAAFFVSTPGARLHYNRVQATFQQLVLQVGLEPRSPSCRPRLHDLRHSFAMRTMIEAYRQDGDVGPRLALLSTYLGHVDPNETYWYLSAAPELMALAAIRQERFMEGKT